MKEGGNKLWYCTGFPIVWICAIEAIGVIIIACSAVNTSPRWTESSLTVNIYHLQAAAGVNIVCGYRNCYPSIAL